MFQNIKVDIVYYKTNTDFELEFNLCGCCRMRLLTDKAPDKKTLVHNLARAVSRSRVILIAGNLFGEDGIMEITANAISKAMTEIDNKLYGITGNDKISIISGSTPLVTPDGYFGGCIIESGPQAMVLLTDNKMVRKTVMNTLIHPYIEDLCAAELKAKAENATAPKTESAASDAEADIAPVAEIPAVEVPAVEVPDIEAADADVQVEEVSATEDAPQMEDIMSSSENAKTEFSDTDNENVDVDNISEESDEADTEIVTDTSDFVEPKSADTEYRDTIDLYFEPVHEAQPKIDIEENTDDVFIENSEDDVFLSGGMIFETDEYRAEAKPIEHGSDNSEFFIESEPIKKGYPDHYNGLYADDAYDDDVYHTEYDENYKSEARYSDNLPILILSIILLVILAVLCYCIFYVPAKGGVSATAYLQETFNTLFG